MREDVEDFYDLMGVLVCGGTWLFLAIYGLAGDENSTRQLLGGIWLIVGWLPMCYVYMGWAGLHRYFNKCGNNSAFDSYRAEVISKLERDEIAFKKFLADKQLEAQRQEFDAWKAKYEGQGS